MRPVQRFADDYLERCKEMSAAEIAQFLDDFMRIHGGAPSTSKLISMKVPENLLGAFKAKAQVTGIPYQTQIKRLMLNWLEGGNAEETK